jgi:acetylglutamate/LysW-gamma-L-alpha-aminoadipate kinase
MESNGMILVKAGGGSGLNWEGIAADLAALHRSAPLILVHGASALRNRLAERLGLSVRTVVSPSGISSVYTDSEALEVFLMAYAGLANKRIVALLQRHGADAVGLTGIDGRLWQARAKKDLLVREGGKTKLYRDNLSGRVETINTKLLRMLLEGGYLPVISAPAISHQHEIVNTDNDTAAAVMAASLGIRTMVYLFEAPGFLENAHNEDSVVAKIPRAQIDSYLPCAVGRMQKKLLGAKQALESGVEMVIFSDGRVDHPVREALAGRGTLIQ